MKLIFKNYWGTPVIMLIQLETINMHSSKGTRRVTYIGLCNFCLIIQGKSNYHD